MKKCTKNVPHLVKSVKLLKGKKFFFLSLEKWH